jgi:hypothetical protein
MKKTHRLLGAAALAGFLSAGCEAGPVCKSLGQCGGDIVGAWAKKPDAPYCQEAVYSPPPEFYLLNQNLPVARMPLPEATNLDWCSSLIIKPADDKGVKNATYYLRDLPLAEARAVYRQDGKFDVGFSRRARFNQHYSHTCLTQYGFTVDCQVLAAQLTTHNQGNPAVSKFECAPETEKGGCNCSFQYEEISVIGGFYTVQGDVVTHFPQAPSLRFNRVGYCVQGDTLEISGLDNRYLMDRTGLRTVELARVNCNDGKAGLGEGGVDCGELCPTPCAAPPPMMSGAP